MHTNGLLRASFVVIFPRVKMIVQSQLRISERFTRGQPPDYNISLPELRLQEDPISTPAAAQAPLLFLADKFFEDTYMHYRMYDELESITPSYLDCWSLHCRDQVDPDRTALDGEPEPEVEPLSTIRSNQIRSQVPAQVKSTVQVDHDKISNKRYFIIMQCNTTSNEPSNWTKARLCRTEPTSKQAVISLIIPYLKLRALITLALQYAFTMHVVDRIARYKRNKELGQLQWPVAESQPRSGVDQLGPSFTTSPALFDKFNSICNICQTLNTRTTDKQFMIALYLKLLSAYRRLCIHVCSTLLVLHYLTDTIRSVTRSGGHTVDLIPLPAESKTAAILNDLDCFSYIFIVSEFLLTPKCSKTQKHTGTRKNAVHTWSVASPPLFRPRNQAPAPWGGPTDKIYQSTYHTQFHTPVLPYNASWACVLSRNKSGRVFYDSPIWPEITTNVITSASANNEI